MSVSSGLYTPVSQDNEEEEEKEPEENNKSSVFHSVCNVLCFIEGTGLLALPYVVERGRLVAIVAMVIFPFILYYTGTTLVECLYKKDSEGQKIRARRNYRDLAEECWPRFGGISAAVIQFIDLFSLSSLFVVLCGSILHDLVPNTPLPKRLWMVIAGIAGLPTLFIKNFPKVAWFSLVSIISITMTILLVLGYGATISDHEWNFDQFILWDTEGSAIALAVILYGYGCHPTIPTVEADMKKPGRFPFVLAISYVFSFIMKTVFAVGGFMAFYPNIDLVITNNISLRPLKILVGILLFVNVFCSYPFLVTSIINNIQDSISNETIRTKLDGTVWFILVRIILTIANILPAITIPHFALMIAFFF